MIKFEKVSFEQFAKDMRDHLMPHATTQQLQIMYDNIQLPKRATKGSAGYDFYSPVSFELRSEDYGDVSIKIPTGIRAVMPQNVDLTIIPRSSVGFKTGVRLVNTIGEIDSDYQYSANEGHILIKLKAGFNTLSIEAGERFAQGIFREYLTVDDDDAQDTRTGGVGSTGV